jgi:magnesium-transporting ATPase (P-type)
VNFHDPKLKGHLNQLTPNSELMEVLLCLVLCHTVILDSKKGIYTSASPDELALVYAAKQFGFEFLGMDSNNIITIQIKTNN